MRYSSISHVVQENWFRVQTSRPTFGTRLSIRSQTQSRSTLTACVRRSTVSTQSSYFTLVAAKDMSSNPANDLRWSINLLLRFDSIYSALRRDNEYDRAN